MARHTFALRLRAQCAKKCHGQVISEIRKNPRASFTKERGFPRIGQSDQTDVLGLRTLRTLRDVEGNLLPLL